MSVNFTVKLIKTETESFNMLRYDEEKKEFHPQIDYDSVENEEIVMPLEGLEVFSENYFDKESVKDILKRTETVLMRRINSRFDFVQMMAISNLIVKEEDQSVFDIIKSAFENESLENVLRNLPDFDISKYEGKTLSQVIKEDFVALDTAIEGIETLEDAISVLKMISIDTEEKLLIARL